MFYNILHIIDKMRIFVTVLYNTVPRGTIINNFKKNAMENDELKKEIDTALAGPLEKLVDALIYLRITHVHICIEYDPEKRGFAVQTQVKHMLN